MSQRYTHLTVDERYQIKAYKKAGFSNREFRRSQGLRGYRSKVSPDLL